MSVKKLLDLTGKVALVTGGSRGLGLQIAEALGEMGAKLAISARKSDELEQAREILARQSIEAFPLVCDISRPEAIEPMVSKLLERHGKVDVLVNNAGATWGAPAEDHPLEAWQKLVNLNLTGTFLVTQAVGKRSMIPNRYGRIINVASIAGLRGNPVDMLETLGYNTTKGGLVNFARAGRRMGRARHHGECRRAGILSLENDEGVAREARREDRRAHAAAPTRRRGGPEGARGAARLGRLAPHHRADHRSRRRHECRLKEPRRRPAPPASRSRLPSTSASSSSR